MMWKKLKSRKGETLVESMVALVIIVMVIAMLPTAVVTAARINATAKGMQTICSQDPDPTEAGETVTITASVTPSNNSDGRAYGTDIQSTETTVTGYSDNDVFYYYEVS